jgi:hypothetical protein
MGHKPVRCKHCNTPITKSFPETKGEWIHYLVRKGTYKGERFFGCHYYDPTIINEIGVYPYIKAEPKKGGPSNAESTK